MNRVLMIISVCSLLGGCVPWRSADTPVDCKVAHAAGTGARYIMYVPSYYKAERQWPLVIVTHGTHGFDPAKWQMQDWQSLAEEKGFIMVAPSMNLNSVHGILPINKMARRQWLKEIADDEKNILSILEDIKSQYNIHPSAILLSGFSGGGYPMYYTGLRNTSKFSTLIALACNFDSGMLDAQTFTEQDKLIPVVVVWGEDDFKKIRNNSWAAVQWLSNNDFIRWEKHIEDGGHFRRPELVYRLWMKFLPPECRTPD